MIAFACSGCGKHLQVKDELAGKKAKCPGCGKLTTIPVADERLAATLSESGKVSPAAGSRPAGSGEPILPSMAPAVPQAGAEARTLPPDNPVAAPRPGEASDTETGSGGPLKAARDHPVELTDFLAPAQAADEIGRLGPYRVLAVLGHGSMGVVFRAEDPGLERQVALKAMLPSLAGNPANRTRFLREAKAAAAVKDDHVVCIHQVSEERGAPFLAMEFLEGEPLDARLKREPKLPVAEVVRIGRETALGLAAAHKRGLIHRDIKPGNLWLEGERARVKILDFGLARTLADETHLTQSGAIVGTPAYMAPEQASGGAVDHRCDLFSLGCVLYRLCAGEIAFKGKDTLAIIRALALETPRPPHEVNPAVPRALSDLVMHLLAKEPEGRPGTAQEVAAALEALAGALEAQAENPTVKWAKPGKATCPPPSEGATRDRPESTRRRWRVLAVALAVVLLLSLVAVGLMFSQRSRPGTVVGNVPRADAQRLTDGAAKGVVDAAKTFTNGLGMEFVLVPKGKFLMGGGDGKVGDKEVEIPYDFYLGKYEVTQEEWQKVTGTNPSYFSRTGDGRNEVANLAADELKKFPVENVSWNDAQLFVETLNAREKKSGWVYRLPTGVEWEYACRGGPAANKFDYAFNIYFEMPCNQLLPAQANFAPEPRKGLQRTCKVGSYQPNRLGLYDMHGNVLEWCADEIPGDPKDPKAASNRVHRGGCWDFVARDCRAAYRDAQGPSFRHSGFGLRLARVPVGKEGK